MKRIALALLASFAFAATTAHAVEYGEVQPDKSRIAFDYQQMGVAMQGTFGKFASALRFDPAAPQTASARIEVELASVDTGSEEGDDEVARKTWFDTKGFPVARFESSTVKPLGGNQLRGRRQAHHQGHDEGRRGPRHLHPAGRQRRLRGRPDHPARRLLDRRRRLEGLRRGRQRRRDPLPHHRRGTLSRGSRAASFPRHRSNPSVPPICPPQRTTT
jgi:hypothetical protein